MTSPPVAAASAHAELGRLFLAAARRYARADAEYRRAMAVDIHWDDGVEAAEAAWDAVDDARDERERAIEAVLALAAEAAGAVLADAEAPR